MEMTRLVHADRRTLYDFLIDRRNERFFGPTIRDCRLETPPPVGEGTEFSFRYRILGFVLETRLRMEEVAIGERYVIRAIRGAVPFAMEYVFADDGSDSRLTVRTTLFDRGWFAWVRPLVAPVVRRDMNAYMDSLVTFCAARAKERAGLPSAVGPAPGERAGPPQTS